MKLFFMSLIISLSSSFALAVETVSHVDLNRYLGQWFEVSSIPAWFQKDCVKNTTAVYKPLDFGKIDVINSCVKKEGSLEIANGIAFVVNRETQAELKVSFVPLFNHFGWFAGQYKILILDPDYQYSVVGEDKLDYGWILSREPRLPKQTLIEIENNLRRLGYDTCRFKMTSQDGGDDHNRQSLCQIVKE
jgi:apolipoprotein D and lipocalin family protein